MLVVMMCIPVVCLARLQLLNQLKDQFEGSVKLVFQPGEEKLPGGASVND
jgi:metal-dependent amidase/aminoacylase/carboxypeptidase family protein